MDMEAAEVVASASIRVTVWFRSCFIDDAPQLPKSCHSKTQDIADDRNLGLYLQYLKKKKKADMNDTACSA